MKSIIGGLGGAIFSEMSWRIIGVGGGRRGKDRDCVAPRFGVILFFFVLEMRASSRIWPTSLGRREKISKKFQGFFGVSISK